MKLENILLEFTAQDEQELKNNEWASMEEVEGWLVGNRYGKVNEGNFSKVYRQPGDEYVVKLTIIEDHCWVKFAKWASAIHRTNKYVPNIKWYRTVKSDEPFVISVVENLYEFNADNLWMVDDEASLAGILLIVANLVEFDPDLDGITKDAVIQRYEDLTEKEIDYGEMKEKYGNHRFLKTLKAIQTKFPESCFPDLYVDNFMIREDDGRVIVVDPLSS